MARIDQTPFRAEITGMTHDGKGVARREDGKAVFVSGALPGEVVMASQTGRNRNFDEARCVEVLEASEHRVEPRCPHFGVCSGCTLQHLEESQQILAKQNVLFDNLTRIGHVEPLERLAPLTAQSWGYRRKGRFSVRRVEKKDKTLVGFREVDPRFVADIDVCYTVLPAISDLIQPLKTLIDSLEGRRDVPQVEFCAGDRAIALTVRHLNPLSVADRDAWTSFAKERGVAVFLQPAGPTSVNALYPAETDLSFDLPAYDVSLTFKPLDFIQVNARLNQEMIDKALAMLDVQPEDRVLDLFCGLGNFTLPLARRVREVVGVEGDAVLVQGGRDNAARNNLPNAQLHVADLASDMSHHPWMKERFNKLLLDPPRSGADFCLTQLNLDQFDRIVYVSCHPASLARDAGYLVNERGWVLKSAGVMDMFPHTGHVESIAMFEKK